MPEKFKKLFGWLDFGGSVAGVAANVLSTILTNRKNEQLARMQNAFQKQENELAYQRANPQNQVSQMMQAGMSKAGALNAINGGATYQPAPITSATAQAPQIDLSSAFDGLLQIGENAKQRKLQEDSLEKQLAAAEAAQKAQFEENERQREHDLEMQSREHTNTNRNADNRLNFDKEQFEFNKSKVLAEINQIKQNTEVLEEVAKGNNLDNLRKEFENMRLPTLAKLADYTAWQNFQYIAMKFAHENVEHMNKQERERLELMFLRATMDSGINLQNVQNELQTYLSSQEYNTYQGPVGEFLGAVVFIMENLVPKIALLK